MSNLNERANSGPDVTLISDRPESPTRTTISKHDSLYFEEGNIVLLSRPKDNIITAFKIYKDFLIVNSAVFKDMFSMPPPQQREEFDNVPCVHVQEEAAQLIPFLSAIYDPQAVPSKRDFYFSLDKVECVFALSKKYQCNNLLDCMRSTLSAMWPKNLESWDRMLDKSPIRVSEPPDEHTLRSTLPKPCFAIRLAKEYEVPEILPTAFYHLFCISSPVFRKDPFAEPGVIFEPQPGLMRLSNEDFLRLFRGSYAIHRLMMDICLIPDLGRFCVLKKPKDKCSDMLHSTMVARFNRKDSPHYNPLALLDPHITINNHKSYLCCECDKRFTAMFTKKRTELWNDLPTFFGLDTDCRVEQA